MESCPLPGAKLLLKLKKTVKQNEKKQGRASRFKHAPKDRNNGPKHEEYGTLKNVNKRKEESRQLQKVVLPSTCAEAHERLLKARYLSGKPGCCPECGNDSLRGPEEHPYYAGINKNPLLYYIQS